MSSSMSNTHPSTPEPLQMCQIDACKKKSSSALLEYQESEGGSSIVLDDCVLYAEGGGQPADFGFVQNIPVVDVQKVPSSSPYPSTAVRVTLKGQLPQEMTTVGTMLECEVNWQRRYDHMQQHTAQHLLSALAYRHFKADTVGWALGSDSVTVDLMSTPPITPAQIEELEGLVNAQIRLGTNVEWVVKPREAIVGNGDSGDDDSKDSTQQESSSDPILKSLRGAPKGAAADIPFLRLVHIDSLDLNPCGGTHLTRLSEIQMLKIIGTEKDRGATRLRFVAGQRCINLLQNCLLRESALTSMLASPPPTHVSKIEKVFQEKKVLEKQIKTLSSEIALGIGSSLASLLSNNNRVIIHHRHGADLAMLSAIADSVMASGCDASILNNSLIFLSGDAELKPEKAPSSSSSSSKGKGGGKGKDETVIPPPSSSFFFFIIIIKWVTLCYYLTTTSQCFWSLYAYRIQGDCR